MRWSGGYSTFAPDAFTTLPHFAISERISFENSAGVVGSIGLSTQTGRSENDVYAFQGRAGEFLSVEVLSVRIFSTCEPCPVTEWHSSTSGARRTAPPLRCSAGSTS